MITPIRILIAGAIAFAVIVYLFKTNIVPRGVTLLIAVSFWVVFRWLSVRSDKAMRKRRAEELEKLKNTSILELEK
jgi:uncharacterized membrane protein YjgN (DUF898 family)